MKYSLAYMAAVLSCGVAAAQDVEPRRDHVEPRRERKQVAQPAQKECCDTFKLDFTTNAALYSFDGNDVVVVSETFSYDWNEKLTFAVNVPFFNDGNDTGVGDLDFTAAYDLYDGKCDFLSANVGFDAIVGVKVPLDGEYSSGGEIFHLGGIADLSWDKITLSQSFDYAFVNDYTYSPIFNGFVGDDLYGGVTTLSYKVNDGVTFSINGTQQYAGDFNAFLVGPSVSFVWKNIDAHVGIDFPVDYSVKAENLDTVVSAGFTINF